MRSDVALDFAIFQLTPTRTRCELFVSTGNKTEKIASGLLQPFLTHLKAAEEQIATGGYSIRLQPRPGFGDANSEDGPWFTKGTMERFVRFVSTPEILERVSIVSAELSQMEEDVNVQANESSQAEISGVRNLPGTPPSANKVYSSISMEKSGTTPQSRRDSLDGGGTPEAPDSSKRRLLRAIDARRLMLQKEQGMAFARAAAAGFDMPHMSHLLVFADCFGATRLRDAAVKFMALCKKRQDAGLWIEEMELAAAEANIPRLIPVNLEGSFSKPKDQSAGDLWPQSDGGDSRLDDFRDDASIHSHRSLFVDGQGAIGGDGAGRGRFRPENLQRRRSAPPPVGQLGGNMRSPNRMETEDEHAPWGQAVNDYHDHDLAERLYSEDGSFPANGAAGSRWPPSLSPPPQRHPSNRCSGGYKGEIGHESAVERGPHSRRSWGTNPSHSFPAQYGQSRGPYAHELDRDYHHDSRNFHTMQNAPAGYYSNQIAYSDGNGGQGVWHQPPPVHQSDQSWQSGGDGYVDGPKFGHPGDQDLYRQQTETGSAGLARMLSPTERRENSIGVAATGGIGPSGATADQLVSDHDGSVSPPEEESHSPTSKTVRRSSSPKRRSPSPLRKLRPSGRRSSMVVIRNINYITSKQRENGDKISVEKESDGNESVDETDLAMDEDDVESKKSASLSVKDAISLFEVKRSESNEDIKKRRSKQGSRRGSTDSTASSMSEKPVLRRWSTTGDLSRGSSTMSRSDTLDDNGDSQKVSAAESINNWPTQTEFSREAHALPKPTDAGDDAVLLLARRTQPSHTGFDPGSESAGPTPIQRENTARNLGTSEEDVLTLPERSSKPPTRNSLHLGSENGGLLSRGAHGDDSFMIPDRFAQSDATSPRIVNHDMNELTQPEMPRISGDSFIVPARASRNEQSGAGWKSDLHFEAEMPEGQQTPPPKVSNASAPHEELFMMPERRDALNWSSAVDHSMENAVVDVSGHQKVVIASSKPGVDSPKEHKGRLYEQYREKRDAKLRGELGSKKVERDAKLKAMQDALEKRKAEMNARSGRTVDKHAPSVDAQLRAEKLRAFKADLARTKKEKDEEERKRLEEMRAQRRERIAARSSPSSGPSNLQSTAATPRGSLRSYSTKPIPMQKLASPQKPAHGGTAGRGSSVTALSPVVPKATRLIQRKSSTVPNTPKNPLSRSVPSLAELRKENTRPPTLRSSIHDRSSLSKLASGTIPPLVRASTAPLEANSMRPVRRAAAVINDDKKRQSMGLRKSLPTLGLDLSKALEATTLKASKTEQLNNKPAAARRLSAPAAVTPEAKPFLRKGRGVVPGVGAVGALKSKESTPPADSIKPKQSPVKIIPPKQSQESPGVSETIRDTNGTHVAVAQIPTSTIRLDSISCPPASLQVPLETKAPVICEEVVCGEGDDADQDTGLHQASGSPYIVHIEDFASPSDTPTSTAPHMDKFSNKHEIHHPAVTEKLLHVQVDSSSPSPPKASTASRSGDDQNHLQSSEASAYSPVGQQKQQTDVHAKPLQGFASLPNNCSPHLQSPPVSSSGLSVAAYDAPVASNSNSSISYKAPTVVASVSPSASPVSESYPILQPSLSPDQAANVNVGKSRKKWGSTEKVPSGAHILSSKEEPKGLRKLLNFGRKSKNSGSHTADSVSASTTVESNGDAEVTSDTGSFKASKKPAESQQNNVGAHSTKSAKATKASKSSKHASLIRESISKDVDIDDSVDERSAPARSFFSLSSFRSKGAKPGLAHKGKQRW